MSAGGYRYRFLSLLLWSAAVSGSSNPLGPDELLSSVAAQEASILQQLFGDENATTVSGPGSIAQSKVWKLEDDGQESVLNLAGTGVGMTVPGSAYAGMGDVACVVTVFDPAVVDGGDVQAVASAVNVELFSFSTQERVTVSGLSEPIQVRMPVSSSNAECSYWNNETERWETDGLATTMVNGQLVCETTHLTFFAAIIRGLVKALLCSNLDLLQEDTIKMMSVGDWYRAPLVIVYWIVLFYLLILFVVACKVDRDRAASGSWDDDHFLILEVPSEESDNASAMDALKLGSAAGCCCAALACCSQLPWGTVFRDVLDDLMSRWCKWFSEIRDFLETVFEAVGRIPELATASGIHGLTQLVMGNFIVASVRRQAGCELGLSTDVVEFVLEDEELKRLLQQPVGKEEQKTVNDWKELHDTVLRTVDEKWETSASWRALPKVVTRVFLMSNPFINVFLKDHSWTSSMRLLFLTCEVCGALVISTIFFTAFGMMRGKQSREDDCTHTGIGEIIGRLLLIGVCSMFLATLPVHLLEALHSRGLKRMLQERWGRQLAVWRVQDVLIWMTGLLYMMFSIFFITLFLANVHPMDHRAWAFTASVCLLQQIVVIPLGLAVPAPVYAALLLSLLSYSRGVSRAELLRQRRSAQSLRGNWRLSVGSV